MEDSVTLEQSRPLDKAQALRAELHAVFSASRSRAYWIALDITRDPEEAADLVGDALLRVERSLPRFRGDCALKTFLFRVVVNLALKSVRRRRVRQRLWHLLPGHDPAPTPTPEHLAGTAEQSRQLLASLARLPAQQQAAFLLRHAHDLSLPEVAQVLGVSEKTVKTHLVRAMQRLRRELKEKTP